MPRPSPDPTRTHADGSICPEGPRRVPRGWKPCCTAFDARVEACFFDIRYEWWSKQRNWFTIIEPSAGGGGVAIAYCPHCGTKLAGRGLSGRYLED